MTVVRASDVLKEKQEHRTRRDGTYYKQLATKLLVENQNLNRALDSSLSLSKHKSIAYPVPETKGLDSEATALLTLSDVHLEERVDYATTNDLNRYNVSIAKDSVMRFFGNGTKLIKNCSRDIPIKNVVLGILGDMISGYIHDELMENNYLSPVEAMMVGEDLLASGIRSMLKSCPAKVKVVCKMGNHGRTTQKLHISTASRNSYEWILYHHIAKEFEGNDQVEFVIEEGYLTYVEIFGKYSIRYHHGNAIKYQGGVGGLTIPANKAIAQWDKERPAYLDIFGHYHTKLLDPGKFICNGSVIGYNSLAIFWKYPYEQPTQSFALIDKKRGKTIVAPIFVR